MLINSIMWKFVFFIRTVPAHTITTQPMNQLDVTPGDNVMFSVAVSSGTPAYTWRLNGIPVGDGAKYSGVNTDTLTVMSVEEGDEGDYSCFVFVDGMTPLFSDAAQLTVCKQIYCCNNSQYRQCHACNLASELVHTCITITSMCILVTALNGKFCVTCSTFPS